MTLKQLLEVITDEAKVEWCFCDGIIGTSQNLQAVLCDEALDEVVDCVESEGDRIVIHTNPSNKCI